MCTAAFVSRQSDDEQGNRQILRLARAGLHVSGVSARIQPLDQRRGRLDRAGQLGVAEERRARARELGHRQAQIRLSHPAELRPRPTRP